LGSCVVDDGDAVGALRAGTTKAAAEAAAPAAVDRSCRNRSVTNSSSCPAISRLTIGRRPQPPPTGKQQPSAPRVVLQQQLLPLPERRAQAFTFACSSIGNLPIRRGGKKGLPANLGSKDRCAGLTGKQKQPRNDVATILPSRYHGGVVFRWGGYPKPSRAQITSRRSDSAAQTAGSRGASMRFDVIITLVL
jgi:hypothetical protein